MKNWFRSRKYVSGTCWGFWLWTDVDSKYILRLHVVKTPWFAVCLHWIQKPDPEPYLHDHPVTFLSLIIKGGYSELRPNICRRTGFEKFTHRWYNWVPARTQHSITHVETGTLTLALMGPKTREWGFWTPTGWVYWKDYYREKRAGRQV